MQLIAALLRNSREPGPQPHVGRHAAGHHQVPAARRERVVGDGNRAPHAVGHAVCHGRLDLRQPIDFRTL